MNTTTETTPKRATKVNVVTGVRVVCDPPSHVGRWIYGTRSDGTFGNLSYGTPEYWAGLKKEYQNWVNELEEFVRDHRSRDSTGLYVEMDKQDTCSCCGCEWEPDDSYENGSVCCAGCGAIIKDAPAK